MTACCNEYELRLFDRQGNYLQSIYDALRIEAARTENDRGTFTIVLPAHYRPNLFVGDNVFEIWRSLDGDQFTLLGDTCWFIRRLRIGVDDEGKETITVEGHDTTGLLDRRVVAWFGSDVAGVNNPGSKQAPAAQILRELFTENFGRDVDNGAGDPATPPVGVSAPFGYNGVYTTDLRKMRRPPFATIDAAPEPDSTPVVTINAAFQNVLEVMKQVASSSEAFGTPLIFDIEYTPSSGDTLGSFAYRTWVGYRGDDLRDSVVLGPDYGTMGATSLTFDYTNIVTNVYVTGATVAGATTPVIAGAVNQELLELSPWHPVEVVVDANDFSLADHLIERALVELNGFGLRPELEGEVIQIAGMAFGGQYNYGDLVSAQWRSTRQTMRIYNFKITVEDGCDAVDVGIEAYRETVDDCVGSECFIDSLGAGDLIDPVALGYNPALTTAQTFTNVNGSGVDVTIQRTGPGTGGIAADLFTVNGVPGDNLPGDADSEFLTFSFSQSICGRFGINIDSATEAATQPATARITVTGGQISVSGRPASGNVAPLIQPESPQTVRLEQSVLDQVNSATGYMQSVNQIVFKLAFGEMAVALRLDNTCSYNYIHACAGVFTRYDRYGNAIGNNPAVEGDWVELSSCNQAPAGVWSDGILIIGTDESLLDEDQGECL